MIICSGVVISLLALRYRGPRELQQLASGFFRTAASCEARSCGMS